MAWQSSRGQPTSCGRLLRLAVRSSSWIRRNLAIPVRSSSWIRKNSAIPKSYDFGYGFEFASGDRLSRGSRVLTLHDALEFRFAIASQPFDGFEFELDRVAEAVL